MEFTPPAESTPETKSGSPEPLRRPVSSLPGVGPRRAEALARLGVRAVADLLVHVPFRYETRRNIETIASAGALIGADGKSPEHVVVIGEIAAVRVARGRRVRVEATLEDETGTLSLTFFNAAWLAGRLNPGRRIRCTGRVERSGRMLRMTNPRWEPVETGGGDAAPPAAVATAPTEGTPEVPPDAEAPGRATLVPVYPATESLPSRAVSDLVGAALEVALPVLEDHLPAAYRTERDLPALADAIRMVHRPKDAAEARAGRRRLAFDELLLLQLAVAIRRRERLRLLSAPPMPRTPEIEARITARLPFRYTEEQARVVEEIAADLARGVPMNRLLQGDVGSGKTVVALDAMLVAAAAGRQSALVAPTELLAEQHHASIGRMLAGADLRVELLTGSLGAAARRERLAALADGGIDLVIGTHALLGDDVQFHRLGLAVLDEQHRFGVHQRAVLRERSGDGLSPHILVMTATPIPRTLALTVYGDLDVSSIRGLPPGRKGTATRVMPFSRAGEVWAHLAERVGRGERGYVVVPVIDDAPDLPGVEARRAALATGPLAGARLEVVHGRMTSEERQAVMDRFRDGEADVLIATTVIEVGVDVPEATTIVIEHADRFGLSQLHQLRGRVGRGDHRGLCVLIADPVTDDGHRRLEAIRSTTDGFRIAEADLEIRGPGEVFGTRQSGIAPFRVADLTRDAALLRTARRDADAWIERSPDLDRPEESMLRARVRRRHGRMLGIGDVG